MIEFLIDLGLIIFISIYWYLKYKVDWKLTSTTPCVVENQTFNDPYGNLFTCDKNLQPVYNDYQPTKKYDGDLHYFNLETHTISTYKPLDGYFEYREPGLEPLYFKKNVVPPFIEKNGKIVYKNSCLNRADDTKVLPTRAEIGIINNNLGTPYAVCKDNRIDRIEYCPKYHDFIGGTCIAINPCAYRSDGYIIEVYSNSYSYCKNKEVVSVRCEKDYTLINYECVRTPCKNAVDGQILGHDVSANTYTYCKDGNVQIHKCFAGYTASDHGCLNNICKQEGPNVIPNGSMYMPYYAVCVDGNIANYVYRTEDVVDNTLYMIWGWSGGRLHYYPSLKYAKGMYTPDGWVSYATPKYMPKAGFYLTFKAVNEQMPENVYNYNYVRVLCKVNDFNQLGMQVVNGIYYPSTDEELVTTESNMEPEHVVYTRLKNHNYKLVILNERDYVDLAEVPFRIQRCNERYVTNMNPVQPCIAKSEIFRTRVNIPYNNTSLMLWDTEETHDIDLIQHWALLEYTPQPNDVAKTGTASRWEDYVLLPNANTTAESPFCGVDTLEDSSLEDTWNGLLHYIEETFDTESLQDTYDMTFDPDLHSPNDIAGTMNIDNFNTDYITHDATFQKYWLLCINSDKSVIKLILSVIEKQLVDNRYWYIGGTLEFPTKTMYYYSERPNYYYLYIYPKDVLKNIECSVVDDKFSIRVPRGLDYAVITQTTLDSVSCSEQDNLVIHDQLPMCVYKLCAHARSRSIWLANERAIVDCKNGDYDKCDEGKVFSFHLSDGAGGRVCELYTDFPKRWKFYTDTDLDINFQNVPIYNGHFLKHDSNRSFVCGNTPLVCRGSYCVDDRLLRTVFEFMLLHWDQDEFDYLYTISDDGDNSLIVDSFEYEYFRDFHSSYVIQAAWYQSLVYDLPIRIKVTKPRGVLVIIGDGTTVSYPRVLGNVRVYSSKVFHFIDYDNNPDNCYIYLHPYALKRHFKEDYNIDCAPTANNWQIVDEYFSKLYLYKSDNDSQSPDSMRFTNPRISGASLRELKADGDGLLPYLAKALKYDA